MLESYARAISDGFPFPRTPEDAHGLLIVGLYVLGSLTIISLLYIWSIWLSLIFATITFIFLEYLPGDRRESIRRNIFSIGVVLVIGIMVGNGQYTVCQREGVTSYNILNTNSIDYNSYGTIWCRTYYFSSHESHENIFNLTNLTPRIMTKLEMTEFAKSLGHKQAIEFYKKHGLNLYRYVFALEAQIQSDGTTIPSGMPRVTGIDWRVTGAEVRGVHSNSEGFETSTGNDEITVVAEVTGDTIE